MDELQRAQRTLGRALGKARAGEDRELAQRVRENGEQLGQMLSGLLKMTRVHAADNKAFDAPLAEFVRALSALADLVGEVYLVAVEDQAYLNEIRLRSEGKPGLRELGAELRRQNVGGVTFQSPLDSRQARALVAAFAAPPVEPAPRTALEERLGKAGVDSVGLHGILRFRTSEEMATGRPDPTEALRRALALSADAWERLAAGRALNPLPLRRSVGEILEVGPASLELWAAWVTGMPTKTHALSVMMHALLLGEAAGLGRGVLQDLGVAALVHDVGYGAIGGGAVAAGPVGLARHPGEGVKALLRQRGFSESKLRRLRAVLDHHRSQDDPRGPPKALPAVLRLAEDYSNFLRVSGERLSASQVLASMAQAGGTAYHPILLQLFVNALGKFPPGTLVELADGRRARTVSPVRSAETFATPLARACDPATGEPVGETLDLAHGPAVTRALPG
jgi:hypothetical protein